MIWKHLSISGAHDESKTHLTSFSSLLEVAHVQYRLGSWQGLGTDQGN